MKDLIFLSWHQWKVCFVAGVKNFCWGLMRIVTCIVLGIVSIIAWLWRVACDFVGKNPKIALGMFFVIACLVWLLTFACMRSRAVGAESQRDAIAWQYQNFKTSHGYYE